MIRLACALSVLLVTAACGGKVVFVEDGGEGGGGSSGTQGGSSSSSVPTTSSGTVCSDLEAALLAATNDARACSPMLAVEQCTGSLTLPDRCGCFSVVANENTPELAAAAQAAFDAWVNAGCGPLDCTQCEPAVSGFCNSTPSGQSGLCESGGFDG